MKRTYLIFGFIVLCLCLGTAGARSVTKLIYGIDDRTEAGDFPHPLYREYALSVAGKVKNYKLFQDQFNPDAFNFHKRTLSEEENVCGTEPFSGQIVLPVCTGFLVADDLLVTAGHCMQGLGDCRTSSWVFDFDNHTESILKENVFRCKEIVAHELVRKWYKKRDYAVVRLDRKVQTFRKPLPFRQKGKVKPGTPLVVIGHPSGLPLKSAAGARVTRFYLQQLLTPIRTLVMNKFYFNADTDTYGGNSGSPIFNFQTGKVEGILSQGDEDYRPSPDGKACTVSQVRKNGSFRGREKIYRITKVKNLKKIVEENESTADGTLPASGQDL